MAANPNRIPGAQRSDASATPLAPSFVQRAVAGMRYAITGRGDPNMGWFGPGQPREAAAPPEVAGRQFDFAVGWNTRQTPRVDEEGTSFADLRALADNYDLLRTVIETRKDQLAALAWTIQPKKDGGTGASDAQCKALQAFFRKPDREHTWAGWLRMIVEDLLVIDAPTIYPRLTLGGQLYALEPVDGATIKRLLDQRGRTPMPPDPAYQQVLKGLPAVDYTRDELIYAPRNPRTSRVYGFSPVEQIIVTVNIALRRQVHTLEYYTSGSVPDALASVPKEWNPQQIKDFQEYWDLLIAGDAAMRRKLRFIPDGVKFIETKQPPLKDMFDEWLARVTCFAFSIEPTAFVAQVNRATAETSRQQARAEGLEPLKQWVKTLLDDVLETRLDAAGCEFVWVDEDAIGPLERAQVDKIYVDAKVLHPDEVRADLGREPLTDEQKADLNPPPPPGLGGPPQPGEQPGKPGAPGAAGADAATDDADPSAAKGDAAGLGKSARAPTSAERAATSPAADAMRQRLHSFFSRAATMIAEQVSAAIDRTSPDAAKGEDARDALTAAQRKRLREILGDLDFASWSELAPDLQQVLSVVSKQGASEGLLRMGIEHDEARLDLVHSRALEWAEVRAAEMVGMKVVDGELVENPNARWAITESTREFIRGDVAIAIQEGWSTDKLAKALSENYAFSDARAETVARTEAARADVQGTLISYAEAGAIGKKWIVGSETDCDVCAANAEAGPIALDAEFPDGTDGPPAHPNCVCDVIPVLPGDPIND
ncbi:MAG: phage portal protein [Burkholderiales bacterium]|jgi:hypothetical protein